MKLLVALLCLMATVYTTSALAEGSSIQSGSTEEQQRLHKWNFMRSKLSNQMGAEYKFIDTVSANSKRAYFFAYSPIGILIGTEDIQREENGNITTTMWHFVADVESGKMTRYLRRVVVKDSGNGILSITNTESTDSENQIKFGQLNKVLYKKIWSLPWMRKDTAPRITPLPQ